MLSKTIITAFLLFSFATVHAQQLHTQLATKGLSHLEQKATKKVRPKRKGFQKVNPLSYLLDAGVLTYQLVFSEQFSSACSYEISCSEYTLRCIRKFGALRGVVMGFAQLQDCHNNARYEHEVIALTPEHKIKNASDFQNH